MATPTLLIITQDMLSVIESENVTTVVSSSTTGEALLCVNIANRVYEKLIQKYKWKHLKSFTNLSAGGNLNELKGSATTTYIDGDNIYYSTTADKEQLVHYLDPEDFIRRTITRTAADTNVTTVNNIKVFNDRDPQWYTSFDDDTLVFDAMPDGSGLVTTDSFAIVYIESSARLAADANTFTLPVKVQAAFRDLCIAKAMIELSEDKQEGRRLERDANGEISKVITSGNLVDRFSDYRKHIITRRGHKRLTIDTKEV